jgi:tetratricopeptide (TPR) repeat protein
LNSQEPSPPTPLPQSRERGEKDTAPIAALSTERTGRGREFFRRAAELIADAADALEHAHSLGIVHRDVKPGNLLLDNAGKVYVSDFGLARFGPDSGLTMSGDLLGTLRYMAPEQALARHGLADHRVDVYGLGCTLYELLTGKPTVGGDDKADILRRIAFDEPVAVRKHDKHIPMELETITLKCLAKNPAERYATAGELAADLRRFCEDKPIKAKPPTLIQLCVRRVRRHPRAVAAAFGVLLLATAGAIISAILIDRQKQETEAAYGEVRDAYGLTRLALDEMSSEVIDDWLARQPFLNPKQRAFLDRAVGYYDRLAARPMADAETGGAAAGAYLRVGEIRQTLGQSAAAEAAYARSVSLYKELADAAPGDDGRRHAHAVALHAWATVLNRKDEADSAYRQALELHGPPDRDADVSPDDRAELALLLVHYGSHLRDPLNSLPDAQKVFDRGFKLMQKSCEAKNARPLDRHRLAQLHLNHGKLMVNASRDPAENYGGRLADAAASLHRAIDLWEILVKEAGNGQAAGEYREHLADGLTTLSMIMGTAGLNRPDDAIAADRRAVEIGEKQVDAFPAVPACQYWLTESLREYGNHLIDVNRFGEAESVYLRAIGIVEPLLAEFPDNHGYREKLVALFRRLACCHLCARRVNDAEQAVVRAVAAQRSTAGSPAGVEDRAAVSATFGVLARWLTEWRRPEAAALARRRASEIGEEGFEPNFDPREAQRKLGELIRQKPDDADAHRRLAMVLAQLGKWDQAISAAREAVRLRPNDSQIQHDLALYLALAPDPKLRDSAGALRHALRATELSPDQGEVWSCLGLARYRSGDWKGAIDALTKALSMLPGGGDSDEFFALAMAQWQIGAKGPAREWYDKGVRWMNQNASKEEYRLRLRAEVEALLGIAPALASPGP